ncbi:LicD family protein [uncultured Methanobrevibacter sp.]|uniref:LicD family protein n=1 Tax=uncultured Methanobrevibacter sp. TaxID=253161 RepID=UPI0025EE360C|nr:LicD family protein [uncultured Methanobrevibacter sp.]
MFEKMKNKFQDKENNSMNIDLNKTSDELISKNNEISSETNNLNQNLHNFQDELDSMNDILQNVENINLSKIDDLNKNLEQISNQIKVTNQNIKTMSHKIDVLNSRTQKLNNHLKSLKKNHNAILDSYNKYFKTIFFDYNSPPSEFLLNLRTLSLELLDFFDNICKKYDIAYWLDFGTLLGAVRHKGFIPWDDDLDMGMMRKDFELYREVINKEICYHGLDDVLTANLIRIPRKTAIIAFVQLFYKPSFIKKSMAALDVFPYDFIEKPNPELVANFKQEKLDFHVKLYNGLNNHCAVEENMIKMNSSYSKKEYIIPGVDNARGFADTYKFAVFKSNKVFPLILMDFYDKKYPCPREYDYHLKKIYGNYFDMPKLIRNHEDNLNYLRKYPDINSVYEENILRLKKINKNFC